MDKRVTTHKRAISPTWGPKVPCAAKIKRWYIIAIITKELIVMLPDGGAFLTLFHTTTICKRGKDTLVPFSCGFFAWETGRFSIYIHI